RAGAGRIAGLGHEAGDHPVKDDAVIEAAPRKLLDPRDMGWRQVGTQLDDDRTGLEIDDPRVLGIVCHYFFPAISLQRLMRALATGGVVKAVTSPSSMAIS